MATHVYLFRVFIPHITHSGFTFPLQPVRWYALKYKMPKEESQALAKYRRQVTALRRQFREAWLNKKRQEEEMLSAKAAEEAKLEREMEEKAFEDNKRENERMARKRMELLAAKDAKFKEKKEKGDIMRTVKERERKEIRMKEVKDKKISSEEMITMDNLDSKIEEIIDNIIQFDYMLDKSGKRSVVGR